MLMSALLLHDSAADHLILNLAGAFEYRQHPSISPESLRLELHRISVSAVNLHRLTGDAFGHLGAERFGQASLVVAAFAGILLRCRVVTKLAPRLNFHRHVRELVANHLEVADRLAKLGALLGVFDRALKSRLRDSHRTGCG